MSTTLLDEPETPSPVHLLLVGASKTGKTDWVADAILDGFTVLYVDADNGLSTIKKRIKHIPEAMGRTHYVATRMPYDFAIELFGAFHTKRLFRWNKRLEMPYGQGAPLPTDKILQIRTANVPYGIIIVLDSWTAAMLQLLQDSAKRNGVSFETFNEGGQAAYGDASRRANLLGSYIQHCPVHVIVQAHPEHYERLEKPRGSAAPKAKDMIVKENITSVSSCSKPHGFAMSKFFNEVGWMQINIQGKFEIDFRQKIDRVGGGSPMKEADPKKGIRFKGTFAEPPLELPENSTWIQSMTVQEIRNAAVEAEKAKAEKYAADVAAGIIDASAPKPAAPKKTFKMPGK